MDILKYEQLVNKIAHKYSNLSNFEDLHQQGMIGLIKAVNNYKENENTKFSTYAYFWIKGEILEYLKNDKGIKISKEILSLSKEITIASEILRNKLNREHNINDLSFFLEKTPLEIEEALLSREIILSCDYSLNNEDENKNVNLYDTMPYYEKKYSADYLDLYNEIAKLPIEERKIIMMHYFEDKTQSEISKELGTNQVNISRKEEKILTKLNKSLAA